MVMDSYSKVLLDTSALLEFCNKKDFHLIENHLGKVKYFITRSVIKELEKLSKESLKKQKCYNLIKKVFNEFEVIEDKGNYADKSLIDLAEKDYIYISNDNELIKELKKKSKRVFKFAKNNMLIEV